jgi:hypothetical protein
VRTSRCLAACLLVCGLGYAGAATGTALGTAKPSPKPLWELYPLDPTGGGARERPAITTETARPSPPPRSGVAGVSTTVTVAAQNGSGEGGTSPVFAILLGSLAAAILLLLLAAVPETATPRLARLRADRRLDIVLAGVLALLVVTVIYLASFS